MKVGCQTPKLLPANSVDQSRGTKWSLFSNHLFHMLGDTLAQGLHTENPQQALRMWRGNRNKAQVTRAKGITRTLMRREDRSFEEVVALEGERLPKQHWRKEGDVGSAILKKLGKRGNGQENHSAQTDD